MAIVAHIEDHELMDAFSEAVFREAARLIAERFVAENYQTIAATLDPQAIANLSVAESAAAINKTLKEKIPDKIVEIHKTTREVYQRGIFGGVKKL